MGVLSPGLNIVSHGGVGCEFSHVVFHLHFTAIEGLWMDREMFL